MSATHSTPTPGRPRFRESAAVVLTRDSTAGPEAYWVKRSDAVGYMPGFRAFIGGKVDAGDLEVPFIDAADFADEERAMRACAVREAFEEAGVLIALASKADAHGLAGARKRLLAGEAPFAAIARDHGWRFRAGDLAFAGRWTTPAFASQRFDTMFFLARVPAEQSASVIPGELESGEWVAPADAIGRWHRGEEAFAAPILHVLRELQRGEHGLLERLVAGPEASGRPVRRIELKFGIVLHPIKTRPLPPATHTNCYVVGERDVAILDPGSKEPAELDALFALLDLLGEDGRKPHIVLITHDHPDHVAGADTVRARHGIPIAAHASIAERVRADVTLNDGDLVPLAPGPAGEWTLRAIHTPGHARGHLCFLHERTRSLFTGDHIPGGNGTVIIDPPEGDMAAYLRSLERLLEEKVETLFPGHGSPQGGVARRIRALIAHRREREARVLAALGAGAAPLEELVPLAYADTRPELWRYAERSLLAHLLKLEAEGLARRDGERWRRA